MDIFRIFHRRERQATEGASTYHFAKLSDKLYEIEKILDHKGDAEWAP